MIILGHTIVLQFSGAAKKAGLEARGHCRFPFCVELSGALFKRFITSFGCIIRLILQTRTRHDALRYGLKHALMIHTYKQTSDKSRHVQRILNFFVYAYVPHELANNSDPEKTNAKTKYLREY